MVTQEQGFDCSGDEALELLALDHYIRSIDPATLTSNAPFVVFTTKAGHAALLLHLFTSVAAERDFDVSRIKGLWGEVQDSPWNKLFIGDPNSYAGQCDVLIVTNVLQAGHSLDTHFVTQFDFVWLNVLSYREEIQFVSRLRYLDRQGMHPFKHVWIERSRANT